MLSQSPWEQVTKGCPYHGPFALFALRSAALAQSCQLVRPLHLSPHLAPGSFGTVAKARPRTGGADVVVKCIVKAKVLSECWDATPDLPWVEALTGGNDDLIRERIPREIVLLMRLKHENIVRAIEVFHNEEIFQLVSTAPTHPPTHGDKL